MINEQITEIEEKLLPYVFDRLNLQWKEKNQGKGKSKGISKVLDEIAEGFQVNTNEMLQHFTLFVQSFIRCLTYAQREITIKDISIASLTEMSYLAGFTLNNNKMPYIIWVTARNYPSRVPDYAEFNFLLTNEIHAWMLYLDEQGLLPGKYDRYTCTFRPKI